MKKVLNFCISAVVMGAMGFVLGKKTGEKRTKDKSSLAEKNRMQFILINQWLKLSREGRSIAAYLIDKGYKKIALYGMSYLGENVLAELKNSVIEVVYGIDKRAGAIASEVDIYSINDNLPKVDAVIVCETYYFDDIAPTLEKKLQCPIVSLEEVIYES